MKASTGKGKRWIGSMWVGLFGVIVSLTTLGDAWARPYRMGKIPQTILGCGVCHVNPNGGGARNSLGQDYEKMALSAGDTYTEALGARDSDGDGYTNDQEFAAGTHPGDPASQPKK